MTNGGSDTRRGVPQAPQTPQAAAELTQRVTTLSVSVATVLALVKLFGWRSSGSVAMLASLADSGLDIVAAFATFAAVRYAALPPDHDHRFGHGKAEGFSSLLQATLVFTSSALIGWEAIGRLIHPAAVQTATSAVLIMVFSTVATAALVAVQGMVLKRTRSLAIEGDRAHYMADLVGNLAALAGILISVFGKLPQADALAGLVVAAWLVRCAVAVLKGSSASLMDRELDDEERDSILEVVCSDPEITGVHDFRTRTSGPFVFIQMHADLDPDMTVERAHEVLVRAERRILERFPAADILIQPDPRGRAEPHESFIAQAHRNRLAVDAASEPTAEMTSGQIEAKDP